VQLVGEQLLECLIDRALIEVQPSIAPVPCIENSARLRKTAGATLFDGTLLPVHTLATSTPVVANAQITGESVSIPLQFNFAWLLAGLRAASLACCACTVAPIDTTSIRAITNAYHTTIRSSLVSCGIRAGCGGQGYLTVPPLPGFVGYVRSHAA
jgi:hypothetical protein